MATLTAQHHEDLQDTEDRVVANALVLLRAGFGVDRVEAYLTRQTVQVPHLGLSKTFVECAGPRCTNVTDTPVRDEYAVFWTGDQATPFCDYQCMDRYGEAAAAGRRSA